MGTFALLLLLATTAYFERNPFGRIFLSLNDQSDQATATPTAAVTGIVLDPLGRDSKQLLLAKGERVTDDLREIVA
jgi:hypothetical protein